MQGAVGWPLVGRDEELELLVAAVGAPGGGSVVVAGAVGVGKSRLLADLLGQVGQVGQVERPATPTVLVRATRSTATIPFGPFARWAPDRRGFADTDRLQVLRDIGAAMLGRHERVVVGVDDAHLLDEGSAALLLHLVVDTPACVVATVRSREPCPDAVTALWKEGLAERVELQPLAEPEMVELLERVLGGALDQAAQRRLWSLTRGTPLYLRELVRVALDQGVLTVEDGRWCWRGALSGSDRLRELMRAHMAPADDEERDLLAMLAYGEPLPLRLVGQLGYRAAVATAEERGVVVVEGAADEPDVRLAHPLYGEVLRGQVPALAARDHQRALARAALAVGWHERDPLRVALWCRDSGMVGEAPEVLLAGAQQALALSEWSLADELASTAANVAPGDAGALLTRAVALSPQGRWHEARDLLAGLSVASLDGERGAEVAGEAARIHAWLLYWNVDPIRGVDAVVEAAGKLPAALRPLALVHCALQSLLAGRPAEAAELAELAMAIDGGGEAPPPVAVGGADLATLEVQALSVLAFARALQGRAGEALAAAEPALPLLATVLRGDPLPGNPASTLLPGYCLALALSGRASEAAGLMHLVGEQIAEGGPPALRWPAATLEGRMELHRGRLGVARRLGELGLSICRETRRVPASHWPASVLACAAAQLGDPAAAEAALDWVAAATESLPIYEVETEHARAWREVARGHLSAARRTATRTAARCAAAGLHAFELFALVDLARFGVPEAAVERLAELAPLVDGAWAQAAVAYVQLLARGDGDGLDRMSVALEEHDALLLAAEASASAARVHEAAGRRGSALTSRGRARALAARCDGPRTPALRDLDTAGAVASLTGREREVVELAARGFTNREIAAELYVSIRTVNTHLYRSYAKLGVNDRAALASLLGADQADQPDRRDR